MSTFTYEKIIDTNKKSIIKLTGFFTDDINENNSSRIQASSLNGALDIYGEFLTPEKTPLPYYELSIYKCWYNIDVNGYIILYWKNDVNTPILILNGSGEYNLNGSCIPIVNSPENNSNGDIGIQSVSCINNNTYTIILELHKNNKYYNAGQLNDPNAFIYNSLLSELTDESGPIFTETHDELLIP